MRFIGLCLLVSLCCPSAVAARTRAILIGIRDYTSDPLTKPVNFADNDAQLLREFSVRAALDPAPVLLNTSKATLAAVEYQVNRVLAGAAPGDAVYIFISSRGIAWPGLDGYLGTANMVGAKPESGGLPMRVLRALIESSRADRVMIFADVSRNPPEAFSNNINRRVAELGNISKPTVAGVLATQPGQRSEERDTPKPGYGVFGFFLANSRAAGGSGISGVAQALIGEIENYPAAKGKQKPAAFGSPPARLVPLWRAGLDAEPDHWRPNFPKSPFLFASRFWFAGLLAMQAPAAESRLAAIMNELERSAPASNPLGLAASLEGLKARMPPELWQPVQDQAVVKLAGDAQKAVDRYGMQNLLPEDPLRVSPEEFQKSADGFAAALRLSPPEFTTFREELRVRQVLCATLANPGMEIKPLVLAQGSLAVIPEVHNAIGMHFLETDPKDYSQAIKEFQKAKAASPGWMYPRHNLALAYIEKGDYQAAEREYRQAIGSEPRQPYLDYDLALLLHRVNRRGEAKSAYLQASRVYVKTIGEMTERAGDWEGRLPAEAALTRRRIEIFAKNRAEVFNSWGALLASARDFKGARVKYADALNINGELCPARYNLAQLEQSAAERKKKDAVSEVAYDLLDKLPSTACAAFEPSRLLKGRLELRKGKVAAARDDFGQVLRSARAKKRAPNAETLKGMAEVEMADNRYSAALKYLDEAITGQTTSGGRADPALFAAMGEARRKMKDPAACRIAYDWAIQVASGGELKISKRELTRNRTKCDKPNE